MTSFCFIANYHLTPLQLAVARRLERNGVRCSFVAVNAGLVRDIRAAGWGDEAILYLPFEPEADAPVFLDIPVAFNDLVLADRALRHLPERGLAYLYGAARALQAFFERRAVDVVFSEPTWAHERLAAALCAGTGRKFLVPFTIRYPSGRWGFFEGDDQAGLLPVAGIGTPDAATPENILNAGPPAYLTRNDQLLRNARKFSSRADRIRRFLTRERIDPQDPTHIQSRWHTLLVKGGEEFNRMRYRSVARTSVDAALLATPFVVYALHKQPESSIDVLGRYYEDQAALIRAIWRSLPPGWNLLVKEHTNAIGDRPRRFYRQLGHWPGLKLVEETTPMAPLLDHARAVFTVSGTVAYEAAMKGTAAFTFAPMFFNRFPRCRRVTIEDLREARDVAALIDALPPHDGDAATAALRAIAAHSFPGRFTDVVSDPTVLEEPNVRAITAGMHALIDHLTSSNIGNA
ncbi:hypothetical protein [Stakelama pacifica]|uniref:Capsular polysaccharide biosynthesis protein n=1 Tax=Stakelama pacifica TaxID=517720 RepID=A0A4V3BSI7_9SPHN|nr:hypothetical protein [Stakelama pacifica]TDN79558.1 hypothetical protein EV664_11237 [Stakelama pacifica]GGP00297.1 hypothetical protein GCM10011329_35850 [Stakelama pacifica]